MTDVATALAPLVPTFLDVAGTLLGGLAVLAVREGVSILKHWAHVDVSAKREASLELAASNAAKAIVAKAPTSQIINEAFSVDDPRVKSAANWIVHESTQHAAAIQEFGTTIDDMAHKIVSKLGGEQTQAPTVVAEPAAPIVPVLVAKQIAAPVPVA
jgi:hypothetical protein